MAEWIVLLSLLLFGIVLLVIEIIFIPGTTIFGLLGFISAAIGIYISFQQLGTQIGLAIFVGFSGLALVAIYFSLKADIWKRFALRTSINSRVNDEHKILLLIGDQGKAISALRPSGKAEFENTEVEVHTRGTFVDAGCLIKVVAVDNNQVVVEPV